MLDQDTSNLIFVYGTGFALVFLISGIFFPFLLRKSFLLCCAKRLFIFSIVFYFTYILIFQILKLYTFKYYADFTVWLELFSNIVHGRGIVTTLQQTSLGSGNTSKYLALHFVPLIYILDLPLYFFKSYSLYLIFLQTFILTSSVIPIYLFARDVFNDKRAGYLFGASFFFFPTIQYINLYDFEFLRLSIPPLLFCFYFLYRRNYFLYYMFFFLSILVREEVALTTFLLGLYAFLIAKERRVGIVTSAVSLLYFLTVVKVVMPYFAGESSGIRHHIAFENFSHLGNSPFQVLIFILMHPFKIISYLLDEIKIANFFMYVLPLLFTPFFSPSIFLITMGNLFINFLSTSISHYSYILYYLSPSIPFLFLSAIKGVKNISDRGLPFLKNKNVLSNKFDNNKFTYTIVSCIFVACVSSNIFFGPSPLSIQFWNKNYKLAPYKTHNFHYSQYIPKEHHRKAFTFFPLIPDDATVSAEHFFLPYLYMKKTLMTFPIYEGADYVFIDKTHPVKFGTIDVDPIEARKNPQKYYDLVEKDTKDWELIKEEDGIFLFKKRQWN